MAKGCRVDVTADSLYIGCTADVPGHGFGREKYDLGVLYVNGASLPVVHTDPVEAATVTATTAELRGSIADNLRLRHQHHRNSLWGRENTCYELNKDSIGLN